MLRSVAAHLQKLAKCCLKILLEVEECFPYSLQDSNQWRSSHFACPFLSLQFDDITE
jgi:hypothetical protein